MAAKSSAIDAPAASASADPETFLSSLPTPLSEYAASALPLTCTDVTTLPSTAAQRIDELEISVRGHLLALASNLLRSGEGNGGEEDDDAMDTSDGDAATKDILAYLHATIDLCIHMVQTAECLERQEEGDSGKDDGINDSSSPPPCYRGMSHVVIRKLPFLLLEDTIDALPPSTLKVIWTSGPTEWITDLAATATSNPTTSLFQRGSQFILLKSCNKLLRKLSNRDRDAAFAGSVMMLLAKVFPLSERSAVNVLGTFNVSNVTDYEDEETFAAHVLTGRGAEDVCEEAEGGMASVIDELMGKASPGRKRGSKGGGMGGATGGDDDEDGAGTVDYPFYKTFWGVQKVFTDPGTILDGKKHNDGGGGSKASAAAASSAAAAFDGKAALEFVGDVRTVLATMEGQPFPAEVVRQSKSRYQASRQRPIANDSSTKSESATKSSDRHHKYLTNSQLLHLQLRDPEMRLHFLTQLLIISSYLSSTIASLGAPKSKTTDILKALTAIRKRAEVLMKQTPPNGSSHLKTVEWLLTDREAMWRKWKANKCQPNLESLGITTSEGGEDDEEAKKRKRRRLMMSAPLGGGGGPDPTASASAASELYSYRLDVKEDLPSIARKMADCVPPLPTFLEEYVDALDPENGIEAEYHPRNDKPFAWRAMRLLAKDNLGRFGSVQRKNGDFERVVRSIWKEEKDTVIPGDEPAEEEVVDLDDRRALEQAAAAEEKQTEADAAGLDDASVGDVSIGSPMAEDDEAVIRSAEDKKKEFEKMAKELEEDMMDGDEGGAGGAEDDADKQAPAAEIKKEDAKKEEKPKGGGKKATPAKAKGGKQNGGGNNPSSKKKRKADDISKEKTAAEENRGKSPAQATKKAKPSGRQSDGGKGGKGGPNSRTASADGGQGRGGGGGGDGGRGGGPLPQKQQHQQQQRGGPPPGDNRRGGGGGDGPRGRDWDRGRRDDRRGRDWDRGRGNDGPGRDERRRSPPPGGGGGGGGGRRGRR